MKKHKEHKKSGCPFFFPLEYKGLEVMKKWGILLKE